MISSLLFSALGGAPFDKPGAWDQGPGGVTGEVSTPSNSSPLWSAKVFYTTVVSHSRTASDSRAEQAPLPDSAYAAIKDEQ